MNKIYDEEEDSLFFNMEQEDPEKYLHFDKKGKICSKNEKLKHTIKNCKLNRDFLLYERGKIYKNFEDEVKKLFLKKDYKNIRFLIEDFKKNTKNLEKNFLAFRKFILKNWINKNNFF